MTKCTKAENAVSPTNAKTLPFGYSYSLKDLYQLTCSTDKISLIPRPSSLGTRLTVLVGAAMLLLLRIWVGLVAAIAVVNAVQCFLDGQYPQKMIYTLQPHEGLWWGAWCFQPCPILTPSSYYPHPPTSFSLSPPQLHPSLPECLECGHCWLQWREVHLRCIHTARGIKAGQFILVRCLA